VYAADYWEQNCLPNVLINITNLREKLSKSYAYSARHQGLIPVILVTQEAETRRITVCITKKKKRKKEKKPKLMPILCPVLATSYFFPFLSESSVLIKS
jgi:hypothetical protein